MVYIKVLGKTLRLAFALQMYRVAAANSTRLCTNRISTITPSHFCLAWFQRKFYKTKRTIAFRDEPALSSIITSSAETRSWLELIISSLAEQLPQLEYTESKYWGVFKNRTTNRNVVYIQPTKEQIRLHTRLPLTYDEALEETSASKEWAERCPSLFRLRSEFDIKKAVSLIVGSYNFDLALK